MVKCFDCGHEKIDTVRNGLHYYTCPTCVDVSKLQNHKVGETCCPKCGCHAHETVIVSGDFTDEGIKLGNKLLDLYPIRPAEKFYCKGCGEPWVNPEFEEYLLKRNIREAKFNAESKNQDE